MALCVANLVNIRPMTIRDEVLACCVLYERAQAWVLKNVRLVKPFPIRGMLSLFEVEDSLIHYLREGK
jgi:hypothetical protein